MKKNRSRLNAGRRFTSAEQLEPRLLLAVTPVEDVFFAVQNQTLSVSELDGVLSNDLNPDESDLSVVLAEDVGDGVLTLRENGAFTYDPQSFSGRTMFSYRIDDGATLSDPVQVELTIGPSPVEISEVLVSNGTGLFTRTRLEPDDRFLRNSEKQYDWVELRNVTTSPLDLSGLHLTDDRRVAKKWEIPEGTMVAPDEFLVVFLSGLDIKNLDLDESGRFHANFSLQTNGEYLAVTSDVGQVLAEFENGLPKQFVDISYGTASDGATGYLVESTPGLPNSMRYAGVVQDTQFSIDRGFYDEPIEVSLSSKTTDAVIRYTIDGSEPTIDNGTIYTTPIAISTTTTLRAAAFKDNYVPTNVDTNTYFYLNDVIRQPAEITGFPHGGRVWAGQDTYVPQDTEMDPDHRG